MAKDTHTDTHTQTSLNCFVIFTIQVVNPNQSLYFYDSIRDVFMLYLASTFVRVQARCVMKHAVVMVTRNCVSVK